MPTNILDTTPLYGLPANVYDPAYGGIPQVSTPGSSQAASITANLGNLASIFNLGGGINQYGAQQAAGQYEANLPGYEQMQQQSSQNILSDLSGAVSPDVQNLLSQTAAERGASSGITGSPNSNAALLRALGITSDALKARGQTELTGAIQRTPTSPLFNVASMMVSPSDQQAAQMYANLLAAAPNPAAAANQAMQNALAAIRAGQGAGGPGPTFNINGAPPGTQLPPTGHGNDFGPPPPPGGVNAPNITQTRPTTPPGSPPPITTTPTTTTPPAGQRPTGNLPTAYGPQPVGYGPTGTPTYPTNDNGAAAYEAVTGSPLPAGAGYDPTTNETYPVNNPWDFYNAMTAMQTANTPGATDVLSTTPSYDPYSYNPFPGSVLPWDTGTNNPAPISTPPITQQDQFSQDWLAAYGQSPTQADITAQFGTGGTDQYGYTDEELYAAMMGDLSAYDYSGEG